MSTGNVKAPPQAPPPVPPGERSTVEKAAAPLAALSSGVDPMPHYLMGAACASLAARRRRSLRAARGCRPGGKGRRRVSLARRTAARPAPPRCCSLRCSRRRRRRATRALCTHRHARARAPPSRDARTLQRAARRPLPAERAPHHLLATPPLAGGTASAVAYTKMNNPRNAAIAGGFALAYFYAGRVREGGSKICCARAAARPPRAPRRRCQRAARRRRGRCAARAPAGGCWPTASCSWAMTWAPSPRWR